MYLAEIALKKAGVVFTDLRSPTQMSHVIQCPDVMWSVWRLGVVQDNALVLSDLVLALSSFEGRYYGYY